MKTLLIRIEIVAVRTISSTPCDQHEKKMKHFSSGERKKKEYVVSNNIKHLLFACQEIVV